MPFGIHTSLDLARAYQGRSFQGSEPWAADTRCIFVGYDPNFPRWGDQKWIDNCGQYIQYVEDPLLWWGDHPRHHPLTPPNPISLQGYHGKVRGLMNLCGDVLIRENIAFVDLLGKPTFGSWGTERGLFRRELQTPENLQHLVMMYNWLRDRSKLVILPKEVLNRMCSIPANPRLADDEKLLPDLVPLSTHANAFFTAHADQEMFHLAAIPNLLVANHFPFFWNGVMLAEIEQTLATMAPTIIEWFHLHPV